MVLVDYLVGIPSPKLHVPDRFEVWLFALCSVEYYITLHGIVAKAMDIRIRNVALLDN